MKNLKKSYNKAQTLRDAILTHTQRLKLPTAFIVDVRHTHGRYSAYNSLVRGDVTTKDTLGLLKGLYHRNKTDINNHLISLGAQRVSGEDKWLLTLPTALFLFAMQGKTLDEAFEELGFGKAIK